jgi:tripartite ATP-independent transporter DctP family solute receptor
MKIRKTARLQTMAVALGVLTLSAGCMTASESGGAESGESEGGTGGEPVVIKAGHVLATSEPTHEYVEKLAERVKERTDGQVEIQVFPSSALGGNLDMLEQSLAGAPVMSYVDAGYLAEYVPDIGVFNGPYLVQDPAEFQKLTSSDWFDEIKTQLNGEGLRILSWNWYFGTRNMIGDKEIRTPADMKGLRVRVPPNQMWLETIKAMGGNPTDLEWSEVYTGLSSGVVDAAEAPLSTLYGSKLYETADTVSMTGHFKAMNGWVIGEEFFSSLSPEVQDILLEEFENYGAEATDAVLASQEEYTQKLADEGLTIVDDVDTEAFEEETKVVYQKFDEWSPGLYDRVQEILQGQ